MGLQAGGLFMFAQSRDKSHRTVLHDAWARLTRSDINRAGANCSSGMDRGVFLSEEASVFTRRWSFHVLQSRDESHRAVLHQTHRNQYKQGWSKWLIKGGFS